MSYPGAVPTFTAYIRLWEERRTFAGHFVHDAIRDPDFPNPKSWRELQRYLESCRACNAAFEGARIVWREYRKQRRKRELLRDSRGP